MVLIKETRRRLSAAQARIPPVVMSHFTAVSFEATGRLSPVVAEGAFTVYTGWLADPEFTVKDFPSGLPFGLYRMDIDTPDAASVLSSSRFELKIGSEFTPLRAVIEAKADTLSLYFVLPGEASAMTLALYSDGTPRLRVGSMRLRRISTTKWRLVRGLRALRRRLASPGLMADDLRAGWQGYRSGGVREIGRRLAGAVNRAGWQTSSAVGMRMADLARQIHLQNSRALRPLPASDEAAASLTIVVPVYKTPETWLLALVDSLNRQTDRRFEVVFVFDGEQPILSTLVAANVSQDYRSALVVLPQNRGASGATNAGIRAATNDFVVVVDHDDLLEPHFVEAFAKASAVAPADIYFSDEAILDDRMTQVRSVSARGQFDVRYYLSHPYIVHPIFVRRALAAAAGLLNEDLRVSQDVDFFLRCVAQARSVVQIPLILYFWRTHASSLGHSGTGEVLRNTRAAVEAFLKRTCDWASFEVRPGVNFNELDVRPPLPSPAKAAIVIPTKNGKEILSLCLASIRERAANNEVPADVYVIDHESTEPATLDYLRAEEGAGRIKVVPHAGPWNYAAINNAALGRILPASDYTHVVLMNNDIELVTPDWLDRMVAQFSWNDVGVVGCCLQYPDGRVQHGGVTVGLSGAADHAHRLEKTLQEDSDRRAPGPLSALVATRDVSAVTAALMVVSARVFEAVGGFDERLAIGFNDTDLCLRIGRLGYHATYVGGVLAVHHESVTRTKLKGMDHLDDTRLFQARYKDMIELGDPYCGTPRDWTPARLQGAATPSRPFQLRCVDPAARPAQDLPSRGASGRSGAKNNGTTPKDRPLAAPGLS